MDATLAEHVPAFLDDMARVVRLRPHTLRAYRYELTDAAGAPQYTLHQFRHTRGSELVEQGQPMEIVQRVLGHRDPRSTQGYAALHDDQVRAALEQQR